MDLTNELALLLKSITRSTYIEIDVSNINSNQINIPRQSRLDNSLIVGVQSFKIDDVAILPVSGNANVSNVVFNKSFLTLQDSDSVQFVERIPLKSLDKIANAGERYLTNYQIVNFENSFIELPETTGQALNTGYFLTIDYVYLRDLKSMGINPEILLKRFK